MRIFGPKSLQQAYALPRLQDSYLSTTKALKSYLSKPYPVANSFSNTTSTTKTTMLNPKPPLLPTHAQTFKQVPPHNTKTIPISTQNNNKFAPLRTKSVMRSLSLGINVKKKHLHMVVVQDYLEEEEQAGDEALSWSNEENNDIEPLFMYHAISSFIKKSY
ncbi:conserved hypothetical protein [Ricinus communis]|uniref:Uncharacterized protein n=1 Tax=Ricinus communis TaxID=3988 RepID=B9RPV6_RICCO|nr:conserved hypothetical protein [Ricinus communis]